MITNEQITVTKNEQDLTVPATIPGLENIDREDIMLPVYYPDCQKGFFWDSLDDTQQLKEINGVLLTYTKGWKLKEGDPAKTVCRSFDGTYGSTGIACDGCSARAPREGIKDQCRRVYDFLFVPDGQDMPTIVSISSVTSLGNVKKYLTLFAKKLQQPLYAFSTKIGFDLTKNAKGQSFYVIRFDRQEALLPGSMADYEKLMNVYRFSKSIEAEDISAEG